MRAISRSRSRNCCTAGSRDARISSGLPTARIFACHNSATLSATRNEPRTSCDTTTLVTPSSDCSRSMRPSITSAFTGSSPEVGSSYKRYFGCPGGAAQRDRLAVLHLEVHAVQHDVVEEALGDLT